VELQRTEEDCKFGECVKLNYQVIIGCHQKKGPATVYVIDQNSKVAATVSLNKQRNWERLEETSYSTVKNWMLVKTKMVKKKKKPLPSDITLMTA